MKGVVLSYSIMLRMQRMTSFSVKQGTKNPFQTKAKFALIMERLRSTNYNSIRQVKKSHISRDKFKKVSKLREQLHIAQQRVRSTSQNAFDSTQRRTYEHRVCNGGRLYSTHNRISVQIRPFAQTQMQCSGLHVIPRKLIQSQLPKFLVKQSDEIEQLIKVKQRYRITRKVELQKNKMPIEPAKKGFLQFCKSLMMTKKVLPTPSAELKERKNSLRETRQMESGSSNLNINDSNPIEGWRPQQSQRHCHDIF